VIVFVLPNASMWLFEVFLADSFFYADLLTNLPKNLNCNGHFM